MFVQLVNIHPSAKLCCVESGTLCEKGFLSDD